MTSDSETASPVRDALRNTEQRQIIDFKTLNNTQQQIQFAERLRDYWQTQAQQLGGGEGETQHAGALAG
jgi:hypothetical protein